MTKKPESNSQGYVAANYNATFFNPENTSTIPYAPIEIPDRDLDGLDA
jgi:hypothetical protein